MITEISKEICIENKLNKNCNFFEVLTYADDKRSKLIPDAISEMCDGDTLIGCYANNFDFLCTNDSGKGALKNSINSVFSNYNKNKLKEKLCMKFCDVEELSDFLNSKF